MLREQLAVSRLAARVHQLEAEKIAAQTRLSQLECGGPEEKEGGGVPEADLVTRLDGQYQALIDKYDSLLEQFHQSYPEQKPQLQFCPEQEEEAEEECCILAENSSESSGFCEELEGEVGEERVERELDEGGDEDEEVREAVRVGRGCQTEVGWGEGSWVGPGGSKLETQFSQLFALLHSRPGGENAG